MSNADLKKNTKNKMSLFLKMSSSPHGRDRKVFREMLSMLLKMRHAPNEIPNISIKGILNENLVTLRVKFSLLTTTFASINS